jgi:septal ring factor EnvC (AmiA/AmiB activator)
MKLRTPLFNAAADDGSENGGATPVNPAEALAKIEDRTLPMGQRLSYAAAALRGLGPIHQVAAVQEQLTQAEATNATLQAQVEQANAERDTARAELAAREQDVTDLQARNAELEQANADLTAREQDITTRADAMVAERIAALGFPAERLPAASNQQQAEGAERIAELREQVEKEKDPKKRGALLAELRALSAEKPVEHGKN